MNFKTYIGNITPVFCNFEILMDKLFYFIVWYYVYMNIKKQTFKCFYLNNDCINM